jgi:mercuric ion binding protein
MILLDVGIFHVICLNNENFSLKIHQNLAMNNKTINIILIIFVFVILVTLPFFVRLGVTADKVVVLVIAGITCGGNVSDLEKALQAKEGIASMEVDVHGGRVIAGFDSKKIRPDEIAATIAGLGYRNNVSEVLSIDQFRAKTGREPGIKKRYIRCSGGCGAREAVGE